MLACCPPPPPHTIQAALDGRSVQSLACCQDVPPHDPNSVWWKDGAKFSVMFPPPMIQAVLDSWSVQSLTYGWHVPPWSKHCLIRGVFKVLTCCWNVPPIIQAALDGRSVQSWADLSCTSLIPSLYLFISGPLPSLTCVVVLVVVSIDWHMCFMPGRSLHKSSPVHK